MNNTQKLFDEWAATYNKFVEHSQETFPFAGYDQVNDIILSMIRPEDISVLDIGIGTGKLAYDIKQKTDARIYGLDLSSKMLKICAEKIPDATLIQHDFGLSPNLPDDWTAFDYIISNYTFHHFDDFQKYERILFLLDKLKIGGRLIIADIGFWNPEELNLMKLKYKDLWDDNEYYSTIQETIDFVNRLSVDISIHKISFCAWILVLTKK